MPERVNASLSGMRVGFDCSPLARPFPAGVVRAVTEGIQALEDRGNIEVHRLLPAEGVDERHWRRRVLPREADRLGLAGIHSFISAFPIRGKGARVQTIHELPWRHGVQENAGPGHRFWAWFGPRRADRVICPSAHVMRDLSGAARPGKVRVIPWGVGPPFTPDPPRGTVDEVVLARLRLEGDPLLLCPGAIRPKKGLARVIEGLACLHDRSPNGGLRLRLVVTGEDTPQLRRDLGLATRLGLSRWISTPGTIPAEDLAALYRLSACVAVLSTSEGFGFPVLEALASGTPVLVPPDSAQSEVSQDAGILVDPADAASVADGFERALSAGAAPQGTAWASENSWAVWAEAVEALWSELA